MNLEDLKEDRTSVHSWQLTSENTCSAQHMSQRNEHFNNIRSSQENWQNEKTQMGSTCTQWKSKSLTFLNAFDAICVVLEWSISWSNIDLCQKIDPL